MQVESCTASEVPTSNATSTVYYQLSSSTKITIRKPSTTNTDAQLSSVHSPGAVSAVGMTVLMEKVRASFAGCDAEVEQALSVAALGLGLSHLIRPTTAADAPVLQPLPTPPGQPLLSDNAIRKILTKAPRGLILYGPPGTGKTTLMKAVVMALGCNYLELSHSLLLSR